MQQAGVVLLFTAAYLAMNTTSYGLQMFMPMILQSLTGSSDLQATFLTAVLFTMALIGMLWNAQHSDRTRERIWHTAAMMGLLSVGLAAAAMSNHVGQAALAFVFLAFVMGPGMYSWLPSYWPMPRKLMGALAAASAVGFINMLGNLGGAIGPWIVGSAPDFTTAMFILAGLPLIAAAIIFTIGRMRRKELMDQSAVEVRQPDQEKKQAEA
jgi:MFS family permease